MMQNKMKRQKQNKIDPFLTRRKSETIHETKARRRQGQNKNKMQNIR